MPTNKPLRLRFTRLSPTHHRFEAIRADGSRETMELETRSYISHDLAHFALEHEGGFDIGFYGLLAAGGTYEATAVTWTGDAGRIERVVAMLQSAAKTGPDPATLCAASRNAFESIGETAPDWLAEDLMRRALARQRSLLGHWRAIPFGETLDLTFPLTA